MITLQSDTYTLEVPEQFESSCVILGTAIAQTFRSGQVMQHPQFTLALGKIEAYDDYPGISATDRILHSITSFSPDLELHHRHECEPGPVQEGVVNWEWDQKEATVHYFVGALVIDEFCYFMRAFCESEVVEIYRPLFLGMWGSLRWTEDRAQMLAELADEPSEEGAALAAEVASFNPPEDQAGAFRLSGRDWGLLHSECKAEISTFDHALTVSLRANLQKSMPDYEKLVAYEGEGLGFRLRFKDIRRDGKVEGEFEFEHGRSQDPNTSLWDDGWEYSLKFTGQVTLRAGWIGLRGVMSKQYSVDNDQTKIEVYYKLDSGQLDWSNYLFSSMEETSGFSPELILHLSLVETGLDALPEKLFEFVNLESLTFSRHDWYGQESPEWPPLSLSERLGDFSKLKVLQLCGYVLPKLPKSLGRLSNLEQAHLSHSQLQSIPDTFWTLPKLKFVSLNNNQLQKLPEQGHLPSLETLDLEHNSLTELPSWLLGCERLRSLKLKHNPWQSLDPGFLKIPELALELSDKMRLFDYSYPGADGQGTVPWDEEKYFLRSDPALRESFVTALRRSSHAKFENALTDIARKTVYLAHGQVEDYQGLGNTRFGGFPDLPKGLPYPSFAYEGSSYACEFIAQLNCAELAPLQSYLPRQGILYFFLDNWESAKPIVFFHPGTSDELVSGATLEASALQRWDNEAYSAYKAEPKLGWSLPSDYSASSNPHFFPDIAAPLLEQEDLLATITEELNPHEPGKHHEINGYVFTQHESPELQAVLKRRGRPEDWTVLLKVASIGGFQWWDAGDLFFVIHKSDLEKGDFSQVYAGIESS